MGDIKASEGGGGLKVSFELTAGAVKKQIGTLGGEFDAEVVVADASFKESYKFGFGKVLVTHAHKADGSLSSDPELDAREKKYAPREEVSFFGRGGDHPSSLADPGASR